MNFYFLVALLLFCSCTNYKKIHQTKVVNPVAQVSNSQTNYDFELPCDTLTSQTQMNICTYEKSKIIDSLVNIKYTCFKQLLENDFKKYVLEKDTEMADYYKSLLDAIEVSQTNYLALSKGNQLFYSELYYGGSIRNMMVNLSAIEDGLTRLKKLDGFIDSMYGDNCAVCK